MDVVFSICIVTRGAVCTRIWEVWVSSCKYCMFVSGVHLVAVLNATFCMTCRLLMLVEDARCDHFDEKTYGETTSEHKTQVIPRHILGSKHNTHTLWKKNNTITFKYKTFTSPTQITNAFNIQFTNRVKHKTHKTNRHIDRKTLKLQTTNITLTTTQVQAEIKQCKNTYSTGPDKVNIWHLKHIGPLGLEYSHVQHIPHTWKQANIIPNHTDPSHFSQ